VLLVVSLDAGLLQHLSGLLRAGVAQQPAQFLQRLVRPDLSNLPQLIAEDLQSAHAQDFGAFPIHRQLTVSQLQELLRLRAELLNHTAFVQTWISKLHPGADEDWRHEPALTQAYLDRLQSWLYGEKKKQAASGDAQQAAAE